MRSVTSDDKVDGINRYSVDKFLRTWLNRDHAFDLGGTLHPDAFLSPRFRPTRPETGFHH